jgi:hypothetical protein
MIPRSKISSRARADQNTQQQLELPKGNAALVVAHPGHELRVHHWLESARPRVFVLTDGSGARNEGRIESTTDILRRVGSKSGSIYGAYTDRRIYQLVLQGRHDEIVRLTEELAIQLETHQIDYVVGDACEGYNPTHDICRLMIGAAVFLAGRRRGKTIGNFDFALTGLPAAGGGGPMVTLHLKDDQFARKVAAARGYRELRDEVDMLDREFGLEAFRLECLRPLEPLNGFAGPPQLPPLYEQFGRQRVAAGTYQSLLTYDRHFRPLAERLRQLLVNPSQHIEVMRAYRRAA